MKKIQLTALLSILLFAIWFSACKDDETDVPILTTLIVEAPFNEVMLGLSPSTMQLTVRGLDQNGNPIEVPSIEWLSSDETKATVSDAGVVTFIDFGNITITAKSGDISGTTDIKIIQPPTLTTINVTAPVSNIVFGVTATNFQLLAEAFDQNGDELENVEYSWSSSDESIATVDMQGMVTVVSAGEVEFTASVDAIFGSASISIADKFDAGTTVFQNVNVVDVENALIITAQDVIVVNDQIETIQSTGSGTIPAGADVIDATGKYLSPGLGDAHVHVFFETDFYQYLANSVTSAIDMGNAQASTPEETPVITWKNAVATGELDAPNFYPALMVRGDAGRVVSSPSQVDDILSTWKEHDFIKVHNAVPPDVFHEFVDQAPNYGLTVMGHGNRDIGLVAALDAGQTMVAHAEEYLYAHFRGENTQELIDEAIDATLNSQAYVTGTLSTYEAISKVWGANSTGYDELKNRPGYEFTNPTYKTIWDNQFSNTYNNTNPANLDDRLAFQYDFVKQFHDAGIPLLLGTDSPLIIGLPAGYSIHEDMRILSEIGISNFDIIKIGTQNFGEFMKKYSRNKEDFGLIKEGHRADLVLLSGDPSVDLEEYRTPEIVMVRGKVYTKDFLDAEVEKLRN
ncbi:MAG: Ig-like domain-containing protein [Fulvivirga sp.]|uniref:Ig-like domain-containing protein n=1 Tax=Fulvivirga sp. TaxID=1931237 RepID=UPI0032EC383D